MLEFKRKDQIWISFILADTDPLTIAVLVDVMQSIICSIVLTGFWLVPHKMES